MKRPSHYNTKSTKAIIQCLASAKDGFLTAAQITEYLQREQCFISRPTLYRQLDKLVSEGKVNRHTFSGSAVTCYQYVDPEDEHMHDSCHLKCEVCNGIFNLECDEVSHISRHISETHAFQVNDSKTVFYGKCKTCRKEVN